MHILHIYKDYYPVLGGIENHLRALAQGLARRGHQVSVLVCNTIHTTQIEHPEANLTIYKAGRWLHTASTPLSPAMVTLARQLRPDIAHLQFPYPPGDLAALALPGQPPLIVSYQSDVVRQRALLRLYRPLLAFTLKRAARLLVASPGYITSSPFLRRYAAKCQIVPLGIDVARFADVLTNDQRPMTNEDDGRKTENESGGTNNHQSSILNPQSSILNTLLFVGRLRYYKGLHILLEALALLQHHIQPQLLIAGSGPEAPRLRAQAAALGLAGQVQWLGDVPDADLPRLYRRADLFVLPSHLRAEAFGLVLAEALASGVACISTELGTGTSFINRHGETGLVVPPDDPPALAAAIHTLLADPALRQRYGAAGQQRVRSSFSETRMLDLVEAVYRDVLRKT